MSNVSLKTTEREDRILEQICEEEGISKTQAIKQSITQYNRNRKDSTRPATKADADDIKKSLEKIEWMITQLGK